MLTGEESPYRAAQVLLTQGPQVVVIKRGEHGALLTTKADIVEFPGYRVSVRDTTCAGDRTCGRIPARCQPPMVIDRIASLRECSWRPLRY